ncbi:hypothetical protein K8I28_15825 [bacterium]|nr:hypothetical protein [bacterium]
MQTRKILSILFILVAIFLSRSFFWGEHPIAWDSFNYILAVEHYAPLEDMPHFPGYLIHVMLAKFINQFVNNPHLAFQLWSLFAGIIGYLVLFLASKELFSTLFGFISSERMKFATIVLLISLFHPAPWFYSTVSLSYINGFLAGTLTVAAMMKWRSSRSFWYVAPLLIGVFAGVRLEIIYLTFLWSWMSWREDRTIARLFLGWLIIFSGIVLWLIPTGILSSSLTEYLQRGLLTFQTQGSEFIQLQGGRGEYLIRIAIKFAFTLLLYACSLLVFLAIAPVKTGRALKKIPLIAYQLLFWWTLPVLLILYLTHLQIGYLMILFPAVIILSAAIVVKMNLSKRQQITGLTVVLFFQLIYFSGILPLSAALPFNQKRIQLNDERLSLGEDVLSDLLEDSTAFVFYNDLTYPWRAAMISFPEVPCYQVLDYQVGRKLILGKNKHEYETTEFGKAPLTRHLEQKYPRLIIVGPAETTLIQQDFPDYQLDVSQGTSSNYFVLMKTGKLLNSQ